MGFGLLIAEGINIQNKTTAQLGMNAHSEQLSIVHFVSFQRFVLGFCRNKSNGLQWLLEFNPNWKIESRKSVSRKLKLLCAHPFLYDAVDLTEPGSFKNAICNFLHCQFMKLIHVRCTLTYWNLSFSYVMQKANDCAPQLLMTLWYFARYRVHLYDELSSSSMRHPTRHATNQKPRSVFDIFVCSLWCNSLLELLIRLIYCAHM